MSDHAAFAAKAALAAHLKAAGHDVLDLGTDGPASVDYPDFGAKGGKAVAAGIGERGLFLCGSGIGIMIAANKVPGIRAALVYDEASARMSRRHNDANVACFGGRVHADARIAEMADVFLATAFEGGRHAARVAKIAALDASTAAEREAGGSAKAAGGGCC